MARRRKPVDELRLCRAIAALYGVKIKLRKRLPESRIGTKWERVHDDTHFQNRVLWVATTGYQEEPNYHLIPGIWHEIGHVLVADASCLDGTNWEYPYPQWVLSRPTPEYRWTSPPSPVTHLIAARSGVLEHAAIAARIRLMSLFQVDRSSREELKSYDMSEWLYHLPAHLRMEPRRVFEALPQFHPTR